jgi:predicted enzyme related to lactoylglutathione lyase
MRRLSLRGQVDRIERTMNINDKINYVEFPSRDIEATKTFFETVFGWTFEDYGPEYAAFSSQGVDGGFYKSDLSSSTENGGALVILYSDSLDVVQARIEQAGGSIVKAIFSFPGGRRFHFTEPAGNEMAVWSDVGA